MKRFFALALALLMIIACFTACKNESGDPDASTTLATTLAATTTAATTTLPPEEDAEAPLYYDDRIALSEIIEADDATSVEIKNQNPTSKKINSTTTDDNVLVYDASTKTFIATATGTATVVADGKEYPVEIFPAPISLFLITGHSIGMGSQGSKSDSVVCEAGQAYSTYIGEDALTSLKAENAGIGYSSAEKPDNINALTPDGNGREGVDGGLAFDWNKLTGEKVWIVNTAVGGSCINEWIQGQANYEIAIRFINAAATILKNEVAAGHYVFKDFSVIAFSAANFGYKNVKYDDQKLIEWWGSMWNGFQSDITTDINGDGSAEKPSSLGFVPIWTTSDKGKFGTDRPYTFHMAASKDHPYAFTASNITRNWLLSIKNYFPKINYEVQDGTLPELPQTQPDLFVDGVHLAQVGYNAYGQDIAKNLYAYLRTENTTNKVNFYSAEGSNLRELSMNVGDKNVLIILPADISASGFDVILSSNLKIDAAGKLIALSAGKGTVTVKQGDTTLGTLNVTVS